LCFKKSKNYIGLTGTELKFAIQIMVQKAKGYGKDDTVKSDVLHSGFSFWRRKRERERDEKSVIHQNKLL